MRGALKLARAWGYLRQSRCVRRRRALDRVAAMLWKLKR